MSNGPSSTVLSQMLTPSQLLPGTAQMAEPSDSPEVQEFMVAFQKLRGMIDDAPELLEGEAADNEPLTNLCMDVWNAAFSLHTAERSTRRLFTSPTNPEFVMRWRDFETRYKLPLDNIAFLQAFGASPEPAVLAARGKDRWEIVASGAAGNAKAIKAVIEHARADAYPGFRSEAQRA
jgi:hypothetical protein